MATGCVEWCAVGVPGISSKQDQPVDSRACWAGPAGLSGELLLINHG